MLKKTILMPVSAIIGILRKVRKHRRHQHQHANAGHQPGMVYRFTHGLHNSFSTLRLSMVLATISDSLLTRSHRFPSL